MRCQDRRIRAAPPPDLVAVGDSAAVERAFRAYLVIWPVGACICAGLVVLVAALIAQGGSAVAWVLAPSLLLAIALTALSVAATILLRHRLRRLRGMRERAIVDAHGLTVATPHGLATVPWDAIHAVRRSRRGGFPRLVIDPVAGFVAPGPLEVDGVGLEPPLDVVAHAIEVRTRGRLRVPR